MRQSRLCPLIVLCSEVASQAEPWTGYGILGGPKYDSNHTLNPLIVLTYCENGRLTKGQKHRKTKAKLSASFGNHGKTYPQFSDSSVGSRAPKEAELPLESGKTYLKSASRDIYKYERKQRADTRTGNRTV